MVSGLFLGMLVVLAVLAVVVVILTSLKKTQSAPISYQNESNRFTPANRCFLGLSEQAFTGTGSIVRG